MMDEILRNRDWEEILTDEEYYYFARLSDFIIAESQDMPFFQIKRIFGLIMEYDDIKDFTYSILEEESKKEVDEMDNKNRLTVKGER